MGTTRHSSGTSAPAVQLLHFDHLVVPAKAPERAPTTAACTVSPALPLRSPCSGASDPGAAARLGSCHAGADAFLHVRWPGLKGRPEGGKWRSVVLQRRVPSVTSVSCSAAPGEKALVIGLAADSGCGKTTFMRRMTSVLQGGVVLPPKGASPFSNTLVSDATTVICLDDYHRLDRAGRKAAGVTALHPAANDFDLMYEQVKALKNGAAVEKPIYNHATGKLDSTEVIQPPKILFIEGLHPMYDPRVRSLLDFSIYLDISPDVKFAWKIQRDMAERGHSLESIQASIEARKPDFDAYVDPQKKHADVVIEVLKTQLIPNETQGKVLRVRLVMKEGPEQLVKPVYLFDEGSTITWTPCGRKLSCSYPGIRFFYGPGNYYSDEVSVLEMDGQFEKLDEMIYIENHLGNLSAKYYGEVTQQMLKQADFPGSNNGTGLFQTIVGLKIRELYERTAAARKSATAAAPAPATAKANSFGAHKFLLSSLVN